MMPLPTPDPEIGRHRRGEVCVWLRKRRELERNAEGARSTVLLTPIPPHLTGREACSHESAVSLTLHIDSRASLMTSSRRVVTEEVLHGDVRRIYNRRGTAKLLLRRKSAS